MVSQPTAGQSSSVSAKTFVIPTVRASRSAEPRPPAMYGLLVSANQNATETSDFAVIAVASAIRVFNSSTNSAPRALTSKIAASSVISWYRDSMVSGVVRVLPPLTLRPASQSVGERYVAAPVSVKRERCATPPCSKWRPNDAVTRSGSLSTTTS